ncbi:MAG: GGDEF domain-containing protein [Spirochaetales bacterium]|uniref:diguanylate cyclase n=1 Tax=Candidatus Thalassospirochaeta sargassi TaxID=3119039 RepID=A0AAJ1MN33_9SPIO|nr:GGDEF domain-containing protein [Spirochaetales bacterium]
MINHSLSCREQYLLQRTKSNYSRFIMVLQILIPIAVFFLARNLYYAKINATVDSGYLKVYIAFILSSVVFRLILPYFFKQEQYKKVDSLILIISILTFFLLIQISLLDSFDFNAYDFTAYIFGSLMLALIYRCEMKTTLIIMISGMCYYIIYYAIARPDIFKVAALLPMFSATVLAVYFSVSRERLNEKLFSTNYQLQEESRHDLLTGLFNRRYTEVFLNHQIAVHRREKTPFSVIFADIDHFKKINDKYGHSIGDDVLKEFSKILSQQSRDTDAVIRYGGEEFVIILSNTTISEAEKIAERIRIKTETYSFSGIEERMTSSFGIAEVTGKDELQSLIKRADENLYRAKSEGRNLCISS